MTTSSQFAFQILLKEIFYLISSLLSFWFQTSDTHAKMIEILANSDYLTQEFILSPLQFGVPYSRPRYFCLVAIIYFVCMHVCMCM